MNFRVKLGDFMLNSGRIIPLYVGHSHFMHFCTVFIVFGSRPEAAGYIISGNFVRPIVRGKCVKFRCPRLNRSGGAAKIHLKAVGCGIFSRFPISITALEYVSPDVPAKFGD